MTIREITTFPDYSVARWYDENGRLALEAKLVGQQAAEEMADAVWEMFINPTSRPEPPAETYLTLDEYYEWKCEQINMFRDMRIMSGYTYQGNVYDSDSRAIANITGTTSAIANGVPLPPTFSWRTADNKNIPMNAAEMVAFGASIMSWVSTIYGVSWYHKDTLKGILASADTDEMKMQQLVDYDFSAGWPQ